MSKVTPILVRLIHGRCGSTLLMQLLSSNRNVISERLYPYEHRYLTYLHSLTKAISAEHDKEWNDESLLRGKRNLVGPLPYNNVSIFDKNNLSMKSFSALTRVFLSSIHDTNSSELMVDQPVYYPEKISGPAADSCNASLDCKSVFLIRDPRDIFLSIRNFNSKRNYKSFNWKEGQTDLEYATWLCNSFLPFLKHYNNIDDTANRVKVRYEDMIVNPMVVTSKLSDWLGLELDYGYVENNMKQMSHHMTSKNPQDSLYRWKTEMSQELQLIFSNTLGEELAKAGYEI
ncbi:hypothetical protein JCM19239_3926 [Vibrio variabilis]|uniref:Sulfotransferase domain-containing protein n=1 Tax=Vibrio variabilis TaxID=990271 RepID=A0ABQ0J604_9VIBR|nr:hypothetical protein JCM19239_3926 [Vibrio variabilis]